MTQSPWDEAVRNRALNFLQVSRPTTALEILAKLPRWSGTASWAGEVDALQAMGVGIGGNSWMSRQQRPSIYRTSSNYL
jgi:hypothetical protein